MDNLKPLKGSLGVPAEGDRKYFARDKIVRKILRMLNQNENLLLSAPRRIGKSSILKYMQKHPQENQIILYIPVQSIDTSEEFFKSLFNELIKNEEIFNGVAGYLRKAKNVLKCYVSRISGFSMMSGEVKVGSDESINYYDECSRLFDSFEIKNKKIVVFVDEFPDALTNILARDRILAIKFLQKNRDLRMSFSQSHLQFVYTGSTGLKNIVKKLDKLDLINDIVEVHVPPLSYDEAKNLIYRLILGLKEENSEFEVENSVIKYILNKIRWKLPYYIQIVIHELFEYYEEKNLPINNDSVDFVLREIVKTKSAHSDYFENWKRRLKSTFQSSDYTFSIEILNSVAKNNVISRDEIYDLSVKNKVEDYRYVIDVLEHDGYLSEDNNEYGFNSILLKEWWYINVAT